MNTLESAAKSSAPNQPQTQSGSRLVKWLVRILVALLIIVVALVIGGLVYQAIGEANDARAYPPPGQMVNVNGLNLHLYCTGEGSPTVIMEAMSGNNSTEWGWIQPEIAKATRVCSYDRAGAGWSDAPATARTAEQTVTDLDSLLQNASLPPPYVFVGHSIGGIFARMYAAQYPEKVVGMVLVDSAHPEQVKLISAMRAEMENFAQEAAMYPWIARLGLFRLFFASGGELDFAELAPLQRAELKTMWSAPKYHDSTVQVLPAVLAMYDDPPTPGTLGDRPLIIVRATVNQSKEWSALQQELAALSTDATQRIAQGATHTSLAFNLEHARTVTLAIQDVVAAVRAKPQ